MASNQLLADPANLAELKTRLGQASGGGVTTKAIEEKHFRRNETYARVIGTWQEWSFNFLTTVTGLNAEVGRVLGEMAKKSATPLTEVSLLAAVTPEMRNKHGAELFVVLGQLTAGDANAVVRGNRALRLCGFLCA